MLQGFFCMLACLLCVVLFVFVRLFVCPFAPKEIFLYNYLTIMLNNTPSSIKQTNKVRKGLFKMLGRLCFSKILLETLLKIRHSH